MWFDPGPNVGYVLPGQVMEYHRSAQVVVVQSVIGGMVRHISPRYAQQKTKGLEETGVAGPFGSQHVVTTATARWRGRRKKLKLVGHWKKEISCDLRRSPRCQLDPLTFIFLFVRRRFFVSPNEDWG